ncbi:MAG TPA: zinc-binding alcohol dehydrogenase family protein [Abditibacteriaceae bacterium]|jgi:2-desacetyl-2-hydroxyethyl bacteriochlorophyllide A dehydrogenase
MKTIVLQEPERFTLTETDQPPTVAPGEALVRVHRVGICGTDLHAYRGRQPFFTYPRTLGHELGVEVVQVGANDKGLAVGDHCAVEPYLNCNNCIACRRGKPNCCVNMRVLGVHIDGGMREFIAVPVEKLHKSDTLSLDQLALVETLCIGAHAVHRAQLEKGELVLVIGAGPIGLSVIQFAQAAGANVIVMDMNDNRLQFCREQLSVEYSIGAADDAISCLQEVTNGDLPTAVFDATGNPQSMQAAFDYPAHGGRLVFVGLFQGEVTFDDPNFHRREMTLLSSRNATPEDFGHVITLMESGAVDTTPWITHRASPGTLLQEFPGWLQPQSGIVKAMLEF